MEMLYPVKWVGIMLFGVLLMSCFILSVSMLVKNVLKLDLCSLPYNDLQLIFCFDHIGLMSACMLVVCSGFSLIYCKHYFFGQIESKVLYGMMCVFVMVMLTLIFSSSLVLSLMFWEYLGFVSFLLILFYAKESSLRASLVTLFSSRFGDVSLFVVLVVVLSSGVNAFMGTWVFWSLMLIVMLTKSAGFPFISWLLEAMRAPTPVSSLVHSSTLVAAGVWFCMRYENYLSGEGMLSLFIFAMLTILISGCCALKFVDLKKLVALSTCNKISWCLMFYVYGSLELALLQLLSHGVSKCFLFILIGDMMSGSGGSQSAKSVYLSGYYGKVNLFLVVFLIFSLCGLPFMGMFFSKHFLFANLVLSSFKSVVLLLVLWGFGLSYAYSCRFVLLVCEKVRGLSLGWLSKFVSVTFLIILGSVLNFLCMSCLEECVEVGLFNSLLFILLQFLGLLWGWRSWAYSESVSKIWDAWLWGCDVLVIWFYEIFNLLRKLSLICIYRWELLMAKLPVHGSFSMVGYSVGSLVLGLSLCLWYVVL